MLKMKACCEIWREENKEKNSQKRIHRARQRKRQKEREGKEEHKKAKECNDIFVFAFRSTLTTQITGFTNIPQAGCSAVLSSGSSMKNDEENEYKKERKKRRRRRNGRKGEKKTDHRQGPQYFTTKFQLNGLISACAARG